MPRLFFTDAAALARAEGYASAEQAARTQEDLGLAQGMPFLLSDDGTPLRAPNRWLQSLPVSGCPSPRTWRAYAEDFLEWERFLNARGRTALDAGREDIAAFHAARRLGDAGPAIAPASWNRKIAALDSFYNWAVEEELLDRQPFSYRFARFATTDGRTIGVKRNLAREAEGRAGATLKWLEEDQLRFFLDVGLSGLRPDGSEDPGFRGRNASRNRAFGELVAGSGLRAQEASHLLCFELPEQPCELVRFVRMEMADAICKRSKGRAILVPPAALQTVRSYIRLERAAAAERGDFAPGRPLPLAEAEFERGRVAGRVRRYKTLRPEDRLRLVLDDGSTPLIFLGRGGAPLTDWEEVFAAATERCRSFQPDFPKVRPHTLRHTFAVHMLRWLIEQAASAVSRKVAETDDGAWAGYWRAHDPLMTLRDLMGHRSVATTQIYLHAIDATRLYASVMDDLAEAGLIDDAEAEEAA